MRNTFSRNILKLAGIITVIFAVLIVAIPPLIYFYYRRYIYVSVESVANNPRTVMVLGAAVYPDDTPSSALQERLNMAVELYKNGKVDRILVSGASDTGAYDEARAMKSALVQAGIPAESIIEDNQGTRTFESCKRAKSEFKIGSLLVVSQGFHLPRALFLCRGVNIESYGIYALGNFSTYHSNWYNYREIGAMYLAFYDILSL